jgi:diguanylate cyclase (GGDEF)-like protein/PAS domain S-box-containing protein
MPQPGCPSGLKLWQYIKINSTQATKPGIDASFAAGLMVKPALILSSIMHIPNRLTILVCAEITALLVVLLHWPGMAAILMLAIIMITLLIVQQTRREAKQHRRQQLAASVFDHAREGISIADTNGLIINVNEAFTRITGYAREEVIGKNSRILASGRQDKAFYAAMWRDLHSKGHWRGEVWNRHKNGELYAEMLSISAVRDDAGKTQHYIALFSDVTEHRRQEDQVQQLAFYDPLTQLPNRRLLADRLQQAMAASSRNRNFGAILFIDLDNFKPLNDLHGHGAGDLLLIEVTARLKNCVREIDTVARFGGDEFVVLLNGLDGERQLAIERAIGVAEKIRHQLATPYHINVAHQDQGALYVEHHCSASLGVTLFIGHETAQDDILAHADAAMYQAKEQGRNRVCFFDKMLQTA